MKAAGGFAEGLGEAGYAVFGAAPSAIAGMEHQEFGADCGRTLQFSAKTADRLSADHRIDGGQIDQIIDMNGKGIEVETFAGGTKFRHLGRIGHTSAPHPRAGGENLKRVGAQFRRGERGFLKGYSGKRVDAQAQSTILPDYW